MQTAGVQPWQGSGLEDVGYNDKMQYRRGGFRYLSSVLLSKLHPSSARFSIQLGALATVKERIVGTKGICIGYSTLLILAGVERGAFK